LFGIAIGPLGLVSVLLVISQPLIVNAWCTLCIVTAAISVVMISPAMDELLASLQYLQRVKRSGHSVWKAFWGKQPIINNVQ
jgi:type IV secretory pathway VirB3-like protein